MFSLTAEPQRGLPDGFFYIYMISFSCSLCLSFTFIKSCFFFFFLICILAYLSDYFPDVISSILYLTSFIFRGDLSIFLFFFKFLNFFNFFVFLGLHPLHMEVPRPGVELELLLLAYTIATATWDPSHVCNLHHSS